MIDLWLGCCDASFQSISDRALYICWVFPAFRIKWRDTNTARNDRRRALSRSRHKSRALELSRRVAMLFSTIAGASSEISISHRDSHSVDIVTHTRCLIPSSRWLARRIRASSYLSCHRTNRVVLFFESSEFLLTAMSTDCGGFYCYITYLYTWTNTISRSFCLCTPPRRFCFLLSLSVVVNINACIRGCTSSGDILLIIIR